MLGLLIAIRLFMRAARIAFRDSEFQTLALIVSIMLAVGTLFYHQVEGWRWVDSLYFSLVTLATVGYGDFSPKTDLGKIFTMFYIVFGIGLLVALVSQLAKALVAARMEHREHASERASKRAQRP